MTAPEDVDKAIVDVKQAIEKVVRESHAMRTMLDEYATGKIEEPEFFDKVKAFLEATA